MGRQGEGEEGGWREEREGERVVGVDAGYPAAGEEVREEVEGRE